MLTELIYSSLVLLSSLAQEGYEGVMGDESIEIGVCDKTGFRVLDVCILSIIDLFNCFLSFKFLASTSPIRDSV